MRNKKGMMRIIEAFAMVLLITGFLLVILNQGQISREGNFDIYDVEQSILREIQSNDSLREEVMANLPPTEWANFPENTRNKIESETPGELNCEAKICALDDECLLGRTIEEDIYVQQIVIFSDEDTYSPRKLKIFCWPK